MNPPVPLLASRDLTYLLVRVPVPVAIVAVALSSTLNSVREPHQLIVNTMSTYFEQSSMLWDPEGAAFTSVETLRRTVNRKYGLNLKDYHDLHKYSVEDYNFWLDIWQFLGIKSSIPPHKVRVKCLCNLYLLTLIFDMMTRSLKRVSQRRFRCGSQKQG